MQIFYFHRFEPPSKAYLEILIGKMVIIRHNAFYADVFDGDYEGGRKKLKHHPRFGHVGTFLKIIDDKAEVKFDQGISSLFPLENVFFFRTDENKIYEEAIFCRDIVKKMYGVKAMEANLAVADAFSNGRIKDALLLAYNNIFCYQFLSFLNAPFGFPDSIYTQKDDDEFFFDRRQRLFEMRDDNLIRDLDTVFANAQTRFRHTVKKECAYSDATFTKKLKEDDLHVSNADSDAIIEQAEQIMDQLVRQIRAYRPNYKYRFDEGDGRRKPCPICEERNREEDDEDPGRYISRSN